MTRGWIWETLKVCDIKYFLTDLKYLYVNFRGYHDLWMSGNMKFLNVRNESSKIIFLAKFNEKSTMELYI